MTDAGKIATLDPSFIPLVQAFKLALLKATGYEWLADQGRRTIAQQNAIYAQGRSAPGKVCTKAKGGQSAHNFGLAVDLVPIKDGDLWWEAPKSLWQQAADLAKTMGLVPGFYFNSLFDPDHFEAPDWKKQQALYYAGKLEVA